jgi:hypothetical protein
VALCFSQCDIILTVVMCRICVGSLEVVVERMSFETVSQFCLNIMAKYVQMSSKILIFKFQN